MNPASCVDPKLNPTRIQIYFWICCIFRSGNESTTMRRSKTLSNSNSDHSLNLLYIQIQKRIHYHAQIQYWFHLEFRSFFESVVYSDPEMNPAPFEDPKLNPPLIQICFWICCIFRSGNESSTIRRSNTKSNFNSDLFLNLLYIQIRKWIQHHAKNQNWIQLEFRSVFESVAY